MLSSLSDTYVLNNGVKIPCVAYGTYKTTDGEVCAEGVKHALELGYRHIDTAEFYGNEVGVGEGIRRSGLDCKDVFVTTKVWNTHQGYDETLRAFEGSMQRLGLNCVDMYLVHWPVAHDFKDVYPERFLATWRAMEELYKNGSIRAIGVCNCLKSHLKVLFDNLTVMPAVNQIEFHLGFDQSETLDFCKENNILVEAWAPLCRGKAFGTEPLSSVARKYGVSEAQILVRWCLQHGVLPLPKSVTFARIAENADVFGFEIADEDMALLDAYDGVGRLGSHPDTVAF